MIFANNATKMLKACRYPCSFKKRLFFKACFLQSKRFAKSNVARRRELRSSYLAACIVSELRSSWWGGQPCSTLLGTAEKDFCRVGRGNSGGDRQWECSTSLNSLVAHVNEIANSCWEMWLRLRASSSNLPNTDSQHSLKICTCLCEGVSQVVPWDITLTWSGGKVSKGAANNTGVWVCVSCNSAVCESVHILSAHNSVSAHFECTS